jgi:hypothetical protein
MGDVRRAWRERVLARRTSRELLRANRESEAAKPELTGFARHRGVAARQAGRDEIGVQTILERAASSVASWPAERPPTFRDVVQYLIVHRCLDADPATPGVRSRLGTIVAEEIPSGLLRARCRYARDGRQTPRRKR